MIEIDLMEKKKRIPDYLYLTYNVPRNLLLGEGEVDMTCIVSKLMRLYKLHLSFSQHTPYPQR